MFARTTAVKADDVVVPLESVSGVPRETFSEPRLGAESYDTESVGVRNNIATGEEKYIVSQLKRHISNSRSVDDFSYDSIIQSLDSVDYATKYSLSFAIIPLKFYSAPHLGKFAPMRISYRRHKPFLALGKRRPVPVYWSNKFVPFDEFIFLRQRSGDWFVKPDSETQHNVTVELDIPLVPIEMDRGESENCRMLEGIKTSCGTPAEGAFAQGRKGAVEAVKTTRCLTWRSHRRLG